MELKSGYKLENDEQLVMEVEANLRETSANPISRLIGELMDLIALILGGSTKAFLVITNKRVALVVKEKRFWVIEKSSYVENIMPQSVSVVGYSKTGTCCCGLFCKKYELFFDSATRSRVMTLYSTDEEAAKAIVDAFYNTLKA